MLSLGHTLEKKNLLLVCLCWGLSGKIKLITAAEPICFSVLVSLSPYRRKLCVSYYFKIETDIVQC